MPRYNWWSIPPRYSDQKCEYAYCFPTRAYLSHRILNLGGRGAKGRIILTNRFKEMLFELWDDFISLTTATVINVPV